MEFLYGTSFLSQSPEAYERLILDAMRGDATLFTRNDEVEAQWRIFDPIVAGVGGDAGAAGAVPGRARRGRRRPTGCARRRTTLADDLRMPRRASYDSVWSAQGTTPGAIEAALREMLKERHAENASYVPARALNLVCVVDKAVERRDRQPPAPASAATTPSRTIVLRGRAASARRSTRWPRSPPTSQPEAGEFALLRETVDRRRRRAAPRAPRHDRRPARRHRPADRALGAPRAPRGGRRAAAARPGRAARLRRRARPARRRSSARADAAARRPTSSTSRGCARRRGASASRRRSTRRTCAPDLRDDQRGHGPPPPRFGGRRRCCSSAGWPRGWAGSRPR